MSFFGSQDFLIEVAKGNVAGHSLVHKFGRDDVVPNGDWVAITPLPVLTFLSAATAVRIKAGGHAADDAAGAGARAIVVTGIDTTLAEVSETITTAGASASAATSAVFWRPYRLTVAPMSAGTYSAANTDDIVVENAAGGTDLIVIVAGKGRSQHGQYSVPAGKTAYLLSVHVTVDSNKAANIRLFTRENLTDTSVPVEPINVRLYWDHIQGTFTYVPRSPTFAMPALCDIWMEAYGDGAASEVAVDFELLLVDD